MTDLLTRAREFDAKSTDPSALIEEMAEEIASLRSDKERLANVARAYGDLNHWMPLAEDGSHTVWVAMVGRCGPSGYQLARNILWEIYGEQVAAEEGESK